MSTDRKQRREDTTLLEKQDSPAKPRTPKRYVVVLLNDDYTPRDFVVWVLQKVFFHPLDAANRIMLEAHTTGKARCGIFTHDEARSKMMQVRQIADENNFPLECRLEAVEDL